MLNTFFPLQFVDVISCDFEQVVTCVATTNTIFFYRTTNTIFIMHKLYIINHDNDCNKSFKNFHVSCSLYKTKMAIIFLSKANYI